MISIESNETYQEFKAKYNFVSPSDIKGTTTPEEYLIKINKPREHKNYFDIGTAAHTMILEPHRWKKEIIVALNKDFPSPDKVNKDGSINMVDSGNKAHMKALRESNPDKVILMESYYNNVKRMAESAMRVKGIQDVLSLPLNGKEKPLTSHIEKSLYVKYIFTDAGHLIGIEPVEKGYRRKKSEILVATRPDLVNPAGYYLDVKTASTIEPESFARDCASLEYDIQGAMGCDIASVCYGFSVESFLILAIENVYPFRAALYDMLTEDLLDAQKVYLRRLNMLRESFNSRRFAGYEINSTNEYGLLTLRMPTWYKQRSLNAKF